VRYVGQLVLPAKKVHVSQCVLAAYHKEFQLAVVVVIVAVVSKRYDPDACNRMLARIICVRSMLTAIIAKRILVLVVVLMVLMLMLMLVLVLMFHYI
jgi:hypothetical protein